jgi:hypothetical protein
LLLLAATAFHCNLTLALGALLLAPIVWLAHRQERTTALVLGAALLSVWQLGAWPYRVASPFGEVSGITGALVSLNWLVLFLYGCIVAIGHACDASSGQGAVLLERRQVTLIELGRWLGWLCLLEVGLLGLCLGHLHMNEAGLAVGQMCSLLLAWHLGRTGRPGQTLVAASPLTAVLGLVAGALGWIANPGHGRELELAILFPVLNLLFVPLALAGLLPMALRRGLEAMRTPLVLESRR